MWSRLDDALLDHPKVIEAGRELGRLGPVIALGCLTAGILFANRYLTDGRLTDAEAKRLTCGSGSALEGLLRAGLWERTVDGAVIIHDFHDWNPTAAQVKAKRKADRERKRKGVGFHVDSTRNPEGIPADSTVDSSMDSRAPSLPYPTQVRTTPYPVFEDGAQDVPCAYCGATPRQTKHANEVDHFVPRSAGGSDAPENLILACHRCNQAKGERVFASMDEARAWLHRAYWTSKRQRWIAHRPFAFGGQPPANLPMPAPAREFMEEAKRIRHKVWGRCEHDPACATYRACITRLAHDLSQQGESS